MKDEKLNEKLDEMRKRVTQQNRDSWFVEHIEEHLEKMIELKDKKPRCKICNKDIDTIANEKFDIIIGKIKKEVDNNE